MSMTASSAIIGTVATDMTDPVHIDSFLSQLNKCVGSTLVHCLDRSYQFSKTLWLLPVSLRSGRPPSLRNRRLT